MHTFPLYNPKAIANFFIDLAKSRGEALTPMKLQKLVYYAVGWYAGYTGRSLINEPVEAWQYGPVISSLYHQFKQFGSKAIQCKATEVDDHFDAVEVSPPDDPQVRQFLSNVWDSYGKFTGLALSEMTHAPDGPWDRTWRKAGGMRGVDIPLDLLVEHFGAAARKTAQTG